MKINTINITRICNVVCALLMFALLVTQFLPFWSLDGQEVSIAGYIGFPEDHIDYTQHFRKLLNDDGFGAGNIVLINVMIMLSSVVGTVLCLKNTDKTWPSIFPAVCGIAGLVQYIATPVFQLGSNWGLHLALSITTLFMAIATFVVWIRGKKVAKNSSEKL